MIRMADAANIMILKKKCACDILFVLVSDKTLGMVNVRQKHFGGKLKEIVFMRAENRWSTVQI